MVQAKKYNKEYNGYMKRDVQNDQNKGRKRRFLVLTAVIAGAILLCVIVIMFILSEDDMPELVIAGKPIDSEEYLEAVSEARFDVEGYFRQTYDADITSDDFWTTTYGNETPYEKVADEALRELCRRYAVYQTAEEKGYTGSYSYQDIKERVEEENAERKAKREAGEVVYGLSEYTVSQFLSYEMSTLRQTYCNDDSNKDMEVSEEEVEEYYNNGGAIIGEDGGIISLEESRNALIYEIQKKRYDEMIGQKADNLSVKTDRKELYEFTLDYIK